MKPVMVGLAPKWVRLAPNGTNPGRFQIRFQCILHVCKWLIFPQDIVGNCYSRGYRVVRPLMFPMLFRVRVELLFHIYADSVFRIQQCCQHIYGKSKLTITHQYHGKCLAAILPPRVVVSHQRLATLF